MRSRYIVGASMALALAGLSLGVSAASVQSSVQSASVVHGEFSTPSGSGRREVSIHVVQTPSGIVNGGYRVDITASGAFFEVEARCLVTIGNTAWVGGIITNTNSPAIVIGRTSYFYAIDNGKADEGLSPDVVSTARINDGPDRDLEFCRITPLLLARLPGLEGDVRVKY